MAADEVKPSAGGGLAPSLPSRQRLGRELRSGRLSEAALLTVMQAPTCHALHQSIRCFAVQFE